MQALLTNSIEIIFTVFIASAIADFVCGLIRINTPTPKECPLQVYNLVMEESVQVATLPTLPDPWMYDIADAPCRSAMATPAAGIGIISPLPKLLLLPPANSEEVPPIALTDVPEEITIPAIAPMPQSNPPIAQKRKPGRPKKDVPAPTVAPKRKRGRPRKTA